MTLVPTPRRWPRGPRNELHDAASDGSLEHTESLLSSGSIDINMGDDDGWTPLMRAAVNGRPRVVRALLAKGAEVAVVADRGLTALHTATAARRPDVIKMLVKAGARVDAFNDAGQTALHLAACDGSPETVAALIAAGSNVDRRIWLDGLTPLFAAAAQGHVGVVRQLLRAKADPLSSGFTLECGTRLIPLDVAAQYGHLGVVRDLILRHGIIGCGGPSNGATALCQAVQKRHQDVVVMLTEAGVFDAAGSALVAAAGSGNETAVKFLLRQQRRRKEEEGVTTSSVGTYVNNARDTSGTSPLLAAVGACSPRVMRILLDAGADTARVLRVTDGKGGTKPHEAAWALAVRKIRENKAEGKDDTQEKKHGLEAVRRLFHQKDAVHAVSWAWTCRVALVGCSAVSGTAAAPTAGTATAKGLRIFRRRAKRPGVLLAALHRYSSSKP